MKRTTLITLIALITITITSCSKSNTNKNSDNGGPAAPQYYLTYKINGTSVLASIYSASRDTVSNPRTITITGAAKNGINPKFKFYTEETFIGFVKGLNIRSYSLSYPSDYLEFTNSAGTLYATRYNEDGIYLFISDISYTKGGTIKGTFNGSVTTSTGTTANITDGTFYMPFSN